jgi:hypothetical protein
MNRLDGDTPGWLKDALRGNVPFVQCACGRVALDPISDTRNGFVGRLRALPDSLARPIFASITIRRLSAAGVYRYAAPQRCDKQCCARALMEVLGKADLEQASERSGKLDEIS